MVSPDCETPRVSVPASRTGSRYRNSLAMSISTGTRAQCSMAYLATSPEWKAVPQATTNTLSTASSCPARRSSSSRARRPRESHLPRRVSRTAAGCSWISLSMKSGNPAFSAASSVQVTSIGWAGTSFPSRSEIRTEPARISTTWPSEMGTNVRVRCMSAGMSEASMFSPWPSPTTNGDESFMPTIRSGSSTEVTTSAYAPVSCRATARTAPARSPSYASSSRWATHSVSVSDTRVWPSLTSRSRIGL